MMLKKFALCSAAVAAGGIALLLYKVRNSRWSDSHTWPVAVRHYLANGVMVVMGEITFRQLMRESKRVAAAQEGALRNAQLGSVEEFRRGRLLTRYHDCGGGETVSQEIAQKGSVLLAMAAGNSSLVPVKEEALSAYYLSGVCMVLNRIAQSRPEWLSLQRRLKLSFELDITSVPTMNGGELQIGHLSSVVSHPARDYMPHFLYSTPPVAYEIDSQPELLYYVQLLFALKDKMLGMIEADSPDLICSAFRMLEARHSELVVDIRLGRFSSSLNPVSNVIREQLDSLLTPDPKRADELELLFESGCFDAKAIWSHLHVVMTATTGSLQVYSDFLRRTHFKSVPFYSPRYNAAAAGGLIGVNLFPDSDGQVYCLTPNYNFYEFIPECHMSEEQPETILTHQVTAGERYEVVVSNAGVFRLRTGDVVEVKYLLYQMPVLKFCHRNGQVLDAKGEKVDEAVFYKALRHFGLRVRDYCCSVLEDEGTFYRVFLEVLAGDLVSSESLDAQLCEFHPAYQALRDEGTLAMLKLVFVAEGTFTRLKHLTGQRRVPRVLRNQPEVVNLLLESQLPNNVSS